MSLVLYRAAKPHLLLNRTPVESPYIDGEQSGRTYVREASAGQLLYYADDEKAPAFLYNQPEVDGIRLLLEECLTEWHSMTGIPASLFHPRVGQSGVSLALQMQGFIWRIQRLRRDLEQVLPLAAERVGLPVSSIEWPDSLTIFQSELMSNNSTSTSDDVLLESA